MNIRMIDWISMVVHFTQIFNFCRSYYNSLMTFSLKFSKESIFCTIHNCVKNWVNQKILKMIRNHVNYKAYSLYMESKLLDGNWIKKIALWAIPTTFWNFPTCIARTKAREIWKRCRNCSQDSCSNFTFPLAYCSNGKVTKHFPKYLVEGK